MEYITGNKRFSFSYKELQEEYAILTRLPNRLFAEAIKRALHFACIVSYLKELPNECTVGDMGIIHRLVHLLDGSEDYDTTINEIREQFSTLLKLD